MTISSLGDLMTNEAWNSINLEFWLLNKYLNKTKPKIDFKNRIIF